MADLEIPLKGLGPSDQEPVGIPRCRGYKGFMMLLWDFIRDIRDWIYMDLWYFMMMFLFSKMEIPEIVGLTTPMGHGILQSRAGFERAVF